MKRILLLFVALFALGASACTNLLVGKKASKNGEAYLTYSADSYGMYGRLLHYPAGTHAPGTMRRIVDGDTHKYLGEIPEAPVTYNVVGNINEHQVAITETTFGGRHELAPKNPMGGIDYVSLMALGLQRAKTAREAIKVMTDLVARHGYSSEGESFSIADPNEVWIMEMIGKGDEKKGAVWVAVRIPDDCISAHANQSRIHKFDLKDKKNVMYSKDVIKFAREKGYFSGKDADFSFSAAYSPADFGSQRFCDARAWSLFNHFVDGMDKYVDFVDGKHIGTSEVMPLYFKPKAPLELSDVMSAMRDHYEGTPLSTLNDCGQGNWDMPYRPTPLVFEYNGKKYFTERPASTQQSAFSYVCQLRSWLPREIGGIIWFANDDANMAAYVPIYCSNVERAECFNTPGADAVTFSDKNAFWVCNWVANMVYPRYSQMFPALKAVRDRLEKGYEADRKQIEERAQDLYNTDKAAAVKFLNDYSVAKSNEMIAEWKQLATYLIVKFNDMAVKPEKDGKFERTESGFAARPARPGMSQAARKALVEQTGDKFEVPAE